MASSVKYVVLISLMVTLVKHTEGARSKKADFTCGLLEYEPNTPQNPHVLDSIPDDIQSGVRLWESPIFGPVIGANYYQNAHAPYILGGFNTGTMLYFYTANNVTQDFVAEQQTRQLTRRTVIRCEDGNDPEYSFIIPMIDMTPPTFDQKDYTCSMDKNWNYDNPILCTETVTLSDNLSPIEEENANKAFNFTVTPNIATVQANRAVGETTITFTLDIFVKESAKLEPENTVTLTATDGENTVTTTVVIKLEN